MWCTCAQYSATRIADSYLTHLVWVTELCLRFVSVCIRCLLPCAPFSRPLVPSATSGGLLHLSQDDLCRRASNLWISSVLQTLCSTLGDRLFSRSSQLEEGILVAIQSSKQARQAGQQQVTSATSTSSKLSPEQVCFSCAYCTRSSLPFASST